MSKTGSVRPPGRGKVRIHDFESEREAISLYQSGLSVRAVANRLARDRGIAISVQTVSRWARNLGQSRHVGGHRTAELGRNAKLLYEAGMTLEQVARRFGIGKTTAAKRLCEMGVSMRPSGSRFLHVLTEKRLRTLYVVEERSITWIVGEFGCSIGTVSRLLRKYGFHPANR